MTPANTETTMEHRNTGRLKGVDTTSSPAASTTCPQRAKTPRQAILNALRYILQIDNRPPGQNPVWDDLMETMSMIERAAPDLLRQPIER